MRGGLLGYVPIFVTDIGLPENLGKEVARDIASVRIGDADGEVALDHKEVLPSRIRTVKSESAKLPYQYSQRNRLKHATRRGGDRMIS